MTIFMVMDEVVLHRIWMLQEFEKQVLKTVCGKPIEVIHPGKYNTNAGPDFLEARVKIGGVEWVGNIEIHIHSSDWFNHHHETDPNYLNVILHVVLHDDLNEFSHSPILILPTETLHGIDILSTHLSTTMNRMNLMNIMPLYYSLDERENLLRQRLDRRLTEINLLYELFDYDWQEVVWILLCRNMGNKVNEEAFETLAKKMPYKTIKNYLSDSNAIEALFFGMAGLLEKEFIDDYPKMLQRLFKRLKLLHDLQPIKIRLNFLRMRPVNFPTIRLAQLSSILSNSSAIKLLANVTSVEDVVDLLHVDISSYWESHYTFDKLSVYSSKKIGIAQLKNIIINVIIPLSYTRLKKACNPSAFELAIQMLEREFPESNHIVDQYILQGFPVASAADTQAILELHQLALKKMPNCNSEKKLD